MFLWSNASVDAAAPNTNVKVTILDESNHRIDLEVKLEQLDDCYNTTNELTKQENLQRVQLLLLTWK